MPQPFQPPVDDYELAPDDGLWLRREDNGGETFRWVLLGPDGFPVGVLELPRDHRIAWSDAMTIWLVEPDEFDVPWLVRYRIVRQRG